MSARAALWALRSVVAGVVLALPLTGCAYDYLQHTDRVAYSAGNAVNANLERETTDPAPRKVFDTRGLGKNGAVIPAPAAGTTTTATSN